MRISDWSSDVCSSDLVPVNFLRWGLGDVLSVAALTPLVLHVLMRDPERSPHLRSDDYASLRERLIWAALMLVALLALITGARIESPFVLGLTAVPLALLLWSAMRFPPIRSEEHTSELQSLMR